MTSTSIGVDTGFARVRVTMRDFELRPTPAGFGAQFQNLDSLLFVSALLVALEGPTRAITQVSQSDREAAVDIVWTPTEASASNLIIWRASDMPTEVNFRALPGRPASPALIDQALTMSQLLRVERVTYRSPVDILLAITDDPVGYWTLAVGSVTGSALLLANRAIKLWERISGARLRHTEASRAALDLRTETEAARSQVFHNRVAEAEARIKEAEAREKEAEVALLESEVALKIAAHDAIREEPDLMKLIYSADIASARVGGAPDSTKSPDALLQRVGQASDALAAIDDIRVIDEREAAI